MNSTLVSEYSNLYNDTTVKKQEESLNIEDVVAK